MTGYGSALRRRMRAMGMVDLPVDSFVGGTHCETLSQNQTCVSRTFGVAHPNLARLIHVSCFMNVFRRAAAPSGSLTIIGAIDSCFMFHVSGTWSAADTWRAQNAGSRK